ncbi:MAG: glycosyltransferase family 9 protein [Rhodospirillales bacterium]
MSEYPAPARRILIIKLGALGDIVQALGPMKAIRDHHAGAHVTLLTTAPYEAFLRASGLFDEIWVDDRPGWSNPRGWIALRRRLRDGRFDRVYDLQTSDRSSGYFRLFPRAGRPEWSGIAPGCSHPHRDPSRDSLHTIERQKGQLRDAGIDDVPAPDLSWADSDISRFMLPQRFVLMVPGGSPHRPGKRWPAERYAVLANTLAAKDLTPVLIGTKSEDAVIGAIVDAAPAARNLMGETSILDLAALARKAAGAVGNDSGPMHLVAAAGTPSVVVYSHESDPALCAQRGPAVSILRHERLDELAPAEVAAALEAVISRAA